MLPFTPMNEDVDRVVENVEKGVPEDDAPAMQGGIGADEPDLGETGEALKQEGALDEVVAEESKD
jgi:hypothetical protein